MNPRTAKLCAKKKRLMSALSQTHQRAILNGFLDIDRRLAEMEAMLAYNRESSPFSRHFNDLSADQLERLATASFSPSKVYHIGWGDRKGFP